MLVISDTDLRKALPMSSAIEAMRKAFIELSAGEAVNLPRLNLDGKKDAYVGLFMPAYSPSLGRSSIKIISVNSKNPSLGRPLIHATVVLNNAKTGETLCTMNGDNLTSIRTAAGAGLATQLLSDPNSKALGILGTGALARTHLEAMLTVRPIEKVWVKGRSSSSSQRFVAEMSKLHQVDIELVTAGDELKQCDIICTVTSSDEAIIFLNDVKPGVHINAMGTYRPKTRELSEDLVLSSTLIVDQMESALSEPGDIMIPIEEGKMSAADIYAELGELAAKSKATPPSESITIFKSVGNGIQDTYAADLVFSNAVELGLGVKVEMG